MSVNSEILRIFQYASQTAGREILKFFDGNSSFDLKDPMQVLTQADLVSHGILEEILKKEFPSLTVVMEEQENEEPLPKSFIVCDELDGTAVFSRGMREFSVILAYINEGVPSVGCIYYPVSGCLLLTSKEEGTFIDGKKIRLIQGGSLDRCILSLEMNNTFGEDDFSWINRASKHTLATRALGATGAGFLELLQGKTDLFMNLSGAKVWDFAAGILALEEAGGFVMDRNGNPLSWDRVKMSVIMARDSELLRQLYELKP